ncbi:thiamine diphosphokinase [Paenibacillus hamazuiensis]|uniref:thiamine diphosphokinase n=1 Tax=Paenibacillus hamazuiensis TaxID=2936508 RepID=UPI003B848B0E
MSERIVIFSGGNLGEWAFEYARSGDILVGVDRGAWFLVGHGRAPALAIGDFDSVSPDELRQIENASGQFITCDPVFKDLTDTEMAFEWALRRRPEEIVMLGVLGTRWDHSLANVHLLRKAADAGISSFIADEHNRIAMVSGPGIHRVTRSRFAQVSLLPLSLEVRGITLRGFQYPLERAALALGQSLGISNVLVSESGSVEVAEGLLLVIESID